MDGHKNKRFNKKNNRSSYSKKERLYGKAPYKEKAKKGGRVGKAPISGFSTLSQVAGVPLKKSYHSSIEVSMPKYVDEPKPICPYCSEPIYIIADSFLINDEYVHFDCVLNSIKESEELHDNQCISYLGSGSFGICERDENGNYTIKKRIEIEKKEDGVKMKAYVEELKV